MHRSTTTSVLTLSRLRLAVTRTRSVARRLGEDPEIDHLIDAATAVRFAAR